MTSLTKMLCKFQLSPWHQPLSIVPETYWRHSEGLTTWLLFFLCQAGHQEQPATKITLLRSKVRWCLTRGQGVEGVRTLNQTAAQNSRLKKQKRRCPKHWTSQQRVKKKNYRPCLTFKYWILCRANRRSQSMMTADFQHTGMEAVKVTTGSMQVGSSTLILPRHVSSWLPPKLRGEYRNIENMGFRFSELGIREEWEGHRKAKLAWPLLTAALTAGGNHSQSQCLLKKKLQWPFVLFSESSTKPSWQIRGGTAHSF